MKILIVEDDTILRDGLVDLVRGAGHTVEIAKDGAAAVMWGTEDQFDLVLLDLMLPRLNGIEVCQRLRAARPALPILMLTARSDEDDKVRGLTVGADDYMTKPFSPRELLARIDGFARRTKRLPVEQEHIVADQCDFDLALCQARRGKKMIALTPREVGIVRWLHRHANRAVGRAELLEQVWGAKPDLETRTVDMTIANLRQKIERDVANPKIILSVKGVGYTWGEK